MRWLLFPVVLLAACHHAPPSPEELLREAQDTTRQFFAVAEGGDCAQLAPVLARPAGCAAMVEEFKATHSHLSQIEGVRIDGRDPQVVLVTVKVNSTKHEHTWVVRAKWTADGWRFAL